MGAPVGGAPGEGVAGDYDMACRVAIGLDGRGTTACVAVGAGELAASNRGDGAFAGDLDNAAAVRIGVVDDGGAVGGGAGIMSSTIF